MTDIESYKAFYKHIGLNQYKSVLCLNGDLPDASFFNEVNLPVIAADGAANYLIENNIALEVIIGDLDSVDISHLGSIKTINDPDQYSSDFQKSINYLKNNNLLPAIILGINGGYIDHILFNMNIFQDANSIFFAPPIVGYIVKQEEERIYELPLNTKISLIGAPKACVTTTGLKWDLKDSVLSFFEISSCFNRTTASQVTIKVNQGSLLTLIYLQDMNDAGK